ncbi:Carboxylesterase [Cooperia oncophora]
MTTTDGSFVSCGVVMWCIFLSVIVPIYAQIIPEPTRPIDLWNPFGPTSTPRPKNQGLMKNEVAVRLSIGDLIGKKLLLENLPWTPNQDPSEQLPPQRSHFEPSPLPRRNNITIFTFLGVPYAEPPVGQRRLKPPQLIRELPTKPYLAFQFGAACAQDVEYRPQIFVNDPYPFVVNEDCLYLNIFSPDISKVSGMSYPVAVFFHGGNFQTGSANEWPAHGLSSRGMVVVTVNYRLGALGFMSLGDSQSGNYGLMDQRLALQWIRDHIAAFGGDPQAVILEDRLLGEFNDFNNVDQEYFRSYALEYAFRHNYSMNREAIVEAIIDRYTFWPDPADEWAVRNSFIHFATDAYYTAPISLSAHLHSAAGSRTFMYVNNYNFSKTGFIPGWMGIQTFFMTGHGQLLNLGVTGI